MAIKNIVCDGIGPGAAVKWIVTHGMRVGPGGVTPSSRYHNSLVSFVSKRYRLLQNRRCGRRGR